MVNILRLEPLQDKKKIKIGSYYDEKHFKIKIDKDTDCYIGDKLLFSFRKNVLQNERWLPVAKKHLQKSILTSDKRKIAGAAPKSRVRINSGIIGFYDRLTPQMKSLLGVHKAGRATAFTSNHPNDWNAVVPMFQILSKWYKKLCPYYYKIQKKEASYVEKGLLIPNTVFSTVTINKDWRTATHTDRGNYSEALSLIAVLGENYMGGLLGFPRYKIAVNVGPGDAILMDGHEPHCNTQLKIHKNGIRFSMVCYLREDMSLFHNPVYLHNVLYYT